MEATINTYQCPACTGPLHFAAGSGKLECEYCGSSYEVAEVEAFYAKKTAPVPKLTCPACKAELNCEGMSGEATCPGCGAEFQMEDLRAYAAQMAEKQDDNMNWDTEAGGQWQEGEADGLRIAHLGDVGEDLSDAQIKALGKLDVLILPVGGFYTIDAAEASRLVERLSPRIVVPMHYKGEGFGYDVVHIEVAVCAESAAEDNLFFHITRASYRIDVWGNIKRYSERRYGAANRKSILGDHSFEVWITNIV